MHRHWHPKPITVDFFDVAVPQPWDGRSAMGAGALRREVILDDHIPRALDQHTTAFGAVRGFVFLHPAGDVAGVDVIQPGLAPDLSGAQ